MKRNASQLRRLLNTYPPMIVRILALVSRFKDDYLHMEVLIAKMLVLVEELKQQHTSIQNEARAVEKSPLRDRLERRHLFSLTSILIGWVV